MEVFHADQTSDEEKNQKTLAALCKCRNAGDNVIPASAFFPLVICVNL
jgi:hypothetical protein